MNQITPAQLDSALARLEEEAGRELRLATEAGDRDGQRLAQNHERAYRKARWSGRPGAYRQQPNGDLLVSSSQGRDVYRVRREPAGSDDAYAPLTCTCEHGQKADAIGLCWHVGLYIGLDVAVLEAERAAAEDDAAYADALAAEALAGQPAGDWLDLYEDWTPAERRAA